MKFKIDSRYVAVLSLKCLVGYLVGVGLALWICDLSDDRIGFIGASLCAAVAMYFVLFFPRRITVANGTINFAEKNGMMRSDIPLSDVTKTEITHNLYNTLTLTTKSGNTYTLHPSDPQSLQDAILSQKSH